MLERNEDDLQDFVDHRDKVRSEIISLVSDEIRAEIDSKIDDFERVVRVLVTHSVFVEEYKTANEEHQKKKEQSNGT